MNPESEEQSLECIVALIEGGYLDRASQLADARLDVDPQDRHALSLLGRIKLRQGHPRQAAELLEQALHYPKRTRALGESQWETTNQIIDGASDADVTSLDIDYLTGTAQEIDSQQQPFDIDDPFGELSESSQTPAEEFEPRTQSDVRKPSSVPAADESDSDELEAEDLAYFQVLDQLDLPVLEPNVSAEDATDLLFDLEEQPEPAELLEVAVSGKLSRRERARQEAIQLAMEYDWALEEAAILQRVFEKHGWSAAKRVMRRELDLGLQPQELDLADRLRDFWIDRPEFSLSISRYAYPVLSWPLALEFIRGFRSTPDIAEMQFVLGEIYDMWYYTPSCRAEHGSFYLYLRRMVSFPTESASVVPAITLASCGQYCYSEPFDEDYQSDVGFNSQLRDELDDLGLLPNHWGEGGFFPTDIAKDY